MPKRPNPWSENSPLQFKSHIGIKEVDMADSQKMESVFEKTKSLLFQGSKKQFHDCDTLQSHDFQFPREHPVEILKGQLRLDSHGQLYSDIRQENMSIHPPSPASMDSNSLDRLMDTIGQPLEQTQPHLLPGQLTFGPMCRLMPVAKGDPSQRKSVAFKLCHVCNHGNTEQLSRCGSCERDTCVSCLVQCSQCDSFVCKICSRVNYEDFLERSVCFGCIS